MNVLKLLSPKEYITKSALETVPATVNAAFVGLKEFGIKLQSFLNNMNENDTRELVKKLRACVQAVCDDQLAHESLATVKTDIEQLKLLGATLSDDKHRSDSLHAADFIDVFVQIAFAHRDFAALPPQSNQADTILKKMVDACKKMNSHGEHLLQVVKTVIAFVETDPKVRSGLCDSIMQAVARIESACRSVQEAWLTSMVPWHMCNYMCFLAVCYRCEVVNVSFAIPIY